MKTHSIIVGHMKTHSNRLLGGAGAAAGGYRSLLLIVAADAARDRGRGGRDVVAARAAKVAAAMLWIRCLLIRWCCELCKYISFYVIKFLKNPRRVHTEDRDHEHGGVNQDHGGAEHQEHDDGVDLFDDSGDDAPDRREDALRRSGRRRRCWKNHTALVNAVPFQISNSSSMPLANSGLSVLVSAVAVQ